MVTGGAPGVGKSSLSHRVVEDLEITGRQVERFDEADILVRGEFAELIAVWEVGRRPSLELILEASHRYIDSCRRSSAEVFVQDALFPFLPSLFAWGYEDDDISELLRSLGELCEGFALVQVHLSGDPSICIPRAAAREAPGWLEGVIKRVATFADGAGVVDFSSMVAYFTRADSRTQRLIRRAPWPAALVDAGQEELAVNKEVLGVITPFLVP